ncbi:MAG TPA: flagellar filament capping protein FliD [Casimicrobiaceae bacterium]|nr:flagellar filament capping protein FliD [Casimicrobiaceae bacterium]
MATTTPALSSPGIGSGLDVNGIVAKLMAVEQRPLDLLNTQEQTVQSRISAYGTLKSALAALQGAVHALATPAPFRAMTAVLGDTTLGTTSVGTGAVPGAYSLEVTQLAQAHKLVSNGFATVADTVGNGTLTFTFGTYAGGTFTPNANAGAKTVTIAPGQDSLAAIRDAVNGANVGVTASIVNDGTANGQRLVFTSTATGAANSLKISAADADGNNSDAAGLSQLAFDPAAAVGAGRNLAQIVAAQDALLKVDGIDIQSASNTVKDAIAGVTLSITKANPGNPTTVTVAQSPGAAQAAVAGFVKAYNDLATTISNLTKYDATNDKASILTGDTTVRVVQSQLRSLIGGTVAGASATLNTLVQVGVKTGSDGQLTFDTAKFNAALSTDPTAVERLFAATGGATDSLVSYAGAGAKTAAGTYPLNVTQIATHGNLVGAAAAGLTISAGVNDALTAVVDGATVSVTLGAATYASASALAAEVASKLNGALGSGSSVRVTDTSGVLTFTSNRFGSASSVTLAGSAAATLVGATPVSTSGVDVAGTIDGVAALGSGQSLTAQSGTPAEGLKVNVIGGALGARGTVTYAQGAGYGLDQMLTSLLGTGGPVAARTDGLQSTIKDMDKRKDALQTRLDRVQAAYLQQFNALDAQLSQLSSLSTYLTQQLANLPKIGGSNNG